MARQITGVHVLIGFVGAFAVIIGVNLVLAYSAVRTFPGLEVANSYVASQTFDARREAQTALGWTVSAHHRDGQLRLSITDRAGAPVLVERLEATVGRATSVAQDTTPDFRFDGTDYVADLAIGAGNWNVRMRAIARDGTEFQQRLVLIKDRDS